MDTALIAFRPGGRQRIPVAEKQHSSRTEKKGKRRNRFNYKKKKKLRETEREKARKSGKGLDISRKKEWTQCQKFVAGRPCRDEDLQLLLDEGPVVVPRFVQQECMARLCGTGVLEEIDGLRTG